MTWGAKMEAVTGVTTAGNAVVGKGFDFFPTTVKPSAVVRGGSLMVRRFVVGCGCCLADVEARDAR